MAKKRGDSTDSGGTTISVALCTCNGDRFLEAQLDSIASQSRLPDEMVISDDASTDRSLLVVEAFAKASTFPVQIFVNEVRLGAGKNFEQAVSRCRGEIIALSDQDDVWRPEKLATIEKRFLDDPVTNAVFSDGEIVDEKLRPLGYRLWEAIKFSRKEQDLVARGEALRVLLRHNVATGATMAFRSGLLSTALPFPGKGVHDEWLALVAAATGRIQAIPEPLILYRQHGANQIGAVKMSIRERLRRARDGSSPAIQERVAVFEEARAMLASGAPGETPSAVVYEIHRKEAHLRDRLAVVSGRGNWAVRFVASLLCGRYHRYSMGWQSAAHDLIRRFAGSP